MRMELPHLTDISPQYIESLRGYYAKILSHVITSDGSHLLALAKAGHLAVFALRQCLQELIHFNEVYEECVAQSRPIPGTPRLKPKSLIPVSNSLSLCLETDTSPLRFILGGQGSITGCSLPKENLHECNVEWKFKLNSDETLGNALALTRNGIAVGCSDSNIYLYDRETHQETTRLTGHQDYIHCLKAFETDSSTLLYSGSEDGSVRIWDMRVTGQVTTLLPFKNSSIERPELGKWIGAIDLTPDGEWLLCGGGPTLSVWHLRSSKCAQVMSTPSAIYSNLFLPTDLSCIMAAGSGNQVTVCSRSKENPTAHINSSIDTIYSIAYHRFDDFDYDMYTLAGNSFKIELCKNAKYIDSEIFVF